jgi:hypothetical protein
MLSICSFRLLDELQYTFCCIYLALFCEISVKLLIKIEHQRKRIFLPTHKEATPVSQESGTNSRTQKSCLERRLLPGQTRLCPH